MKQSVKMIVGNWKMHGLAGGLEEARTLRRAVEAERPACRVALCPPATLIERMHRVLAGGPVELGGQDCDPRPSGAYTGCISAEMLADAGATLVILGHSERRDEFFETDEYIAAKAEAAVAAGLEPVLCVGESLEEREGGDAVRIVTGQVEAALPDVLSERPFAVAYEPIWAIGTGHTPTLAQIAEMHDAIGRAIVKRLGQGASHAPILYGGSVKPENAKDILATREVGGALVGGASLKAEDFLKIVRAA